MPKGVEVRLLSRAPFVALLLRTSTRTVSSPVAEPHQSSVRYGAGNGRSLRLFAPLDFWTTSSMAEHRVYIARVIGSSPMPSTKPDKISFRNFACGAGVAHVVERNSEKIEVTSASLVSGTIMHIYIIGLL